MLNIYDAIGSIVADINNYGVRLNYLYGSAREVQQTLVEWSKDPQMKEKKYPCLIMFTPIAVERELYTTTTVTIILVKDTEKNYKTHERITNVYEPYLWPIYELFMHFLRLSINFDIDSSGRVPQTTTDIFFYSPTPAHEQNVFSAVLDAIEIADLELTLVDKGCSSEGIEGFVYNVIHEGENVIHEGENVIQTMI